MYQIGSGSFVGVGNKVRFVAKSSGKLKLGIVMYSSYTRGNYQFPGAYKVKIRVQPPSSEK